MGTKLKLWNDRNESIFCHDCRIRTQRITKKLSNLFKSNFLKLRILKFCEEYHDAICCLCDNSDNYMNIFDVSIRFHTTWYFKMPQH